MPAFTIKAFLMCTRLLFGHKTDILVKRFQGGIRMEIRVLKYFLTVVRREALTVPQRFTKDHFNG